MSDIITHENINRYGDFAEIYNLNRPIPPKIIRDIIHIYSASEPSLVVDIGSGTGLSTFIWKDTASKIVGIEPDDRMRQIAEKLVTSDNISFKKGLSHDTGIETESVDVVTISQALHWMDVKITFDEVYRILVPDGIFAVYDCIPPSVDWVVEKEFSLLRAKCDRVNIKNDVTPVRNNTNIDVFRNYGKFRFVKEIDCHSVESCTRERLFGIALSQASIQQAMKINSKIRDAVDKYYDVIHKRCQEEFEIVFSYKLKIAIK